METITREQKKDIRLLGTFVEVYCRGRHTKRERDRVLLTGSAGESSVCSECREFLDYAISKRLTCPLEAEKPICKRCRIHCYAKDQREKIREIMSYAGRKMVMRGRFDYLWHYFF